jgi:outer membrane protein assembly factor BamB
MQQDGGRECVSCYRVRDGGLVWNYAIDSRHENILGGVGPRSTPTIHQGRIYALGAMGDLCCLDAATGQPIWTVDLLKLAGIATIQKTNSRGENYEIEQSTVAWGRAASPLVHESRVIVPLGGTNTLVALNIETGDVEWQGGKQPPSYSSPVLATIAGQTQVVIVNESSVSGHDAQTGEELWLYSRPGSSSNDANTSLATIVADGQILVSKGYGAGGELLEVTRADDGRYQVKSLWKSPRVLKTKLTNAIVRDGSIYAISNELLECVDAVTGERRWRAPQRFGHGQILLVGDFILAHTEHGELVLCEASPIRYHELGRMPTIAGVCWNTIGLYENKVLVRSDREMACIELPVSTQRNVALHLPKVRVEEVRLSGLNNQGW